MLDYAKLYAIMCGAVSDALNVMPRTLENYSARRTRRMKMMCRAHFTGARKKSSF